MSDEDSSQEKTEEPTPRRLEKSREEGQTARSRELTTTFILLGGAIGLYIFGQGMAEALANIMRANFSFEREAIFDPNMMGINLIAAFRDGLLSLGPLFLVLLIASIAGPVGLGGWLLSAKAMAPKFNRMNPLSGLKRMFSVKALVELAKALAKVLIILSVAVLFLIAREREMLSLANQGLRPALQHSLDLAMWAAILLASVTILITLVDVPFQMWDHARKLKMSRQDIKDEMKDSEGKPEVKGRIRQLQREMAQNRMMAAVPEADVIITNPTHFSVALKYNPDSMETPVMIAKGQDHIALKIREIGRAHNVEILESPVLARAIFYTTEIDQEIPGQLYVAVAQVLAYVFQLRMYRKDRARNPKPEYPRNIKVPRDMRY